MAQADDIRLDIGVFAHDEEAVIGRLISDLAAQSIFGVPGFDPRVRVMANGCSDATVAVAEEARQALPESLRARFEVVDLEPGGKSRTVNLFIHEMSRPDADLLCFMDADILLPVPDGLERMVRRMQQRPELQVFVSRPVKDVQHFDLDAGPVARLIASAGGGLTDYRRSICGQLYVMRGTMARRIALPAGLPVEDGFMRAMVLTDLFSKPEDFGRIDGDPEIFHVYESIRSIRELLHHQTRLVIGSAINAALYGFFDRENLRGEALRAFLMAQAQEEGWLARRLDADLPRKPFGYVPFSFATNRIAGFRRLGKRGGRALLITAIGAVMDGIVYLRASLRMWRGQASGFW